MSSPAPLILPHVPKTAGTSLRAALTAFYGDRLRLDYADTPLQHSRGYRRGQALANALIRTGRALDADCVYGHFLPIKYLGVRGARFALWIRDPVQRVVSRFHHYQRACAAGELGHARWGLVPGLTLHQFAALPQYRNTYSEYLWLFPLRRFEFVGEVESLKSDLPRFAGHFGLELPAILPRENANPENAASSYALEPALVDHIRTLNQADVRLLDALREIRRRGAG